MDYISQNISKQIAIITISKGKVNPLNEQVVDELTKTLEKLRSDNDCRAIILTGQGGFFSFGLDIPELYQYSKEDFELFLLKFTNLYRLIFSYPKPIIAALNGHAIAGGCMLAIACDYRIMTVGKAKISLNEITFGSSVFAGSTEILKFIVGNRNAEKFLISGEMYDADQAYSIGLIDLVTDNDDFERSVWNIAKSFARKDQPAFASIKKLLRQATLKKIEQYEFDSIREFNDIWYSDSTRKMTKNITIR